jgi:NTE family protein
MLRDLGRAAGEDFLKAHANDLGRRSSVNLDVLLEGI